MSRAESSAVRPAGAIADSALAVIVLAAPLAVATVHPATWLVAWLLALVALGASALDRHHSASVAPALAWLLATSPDPNFRDGPQAVTLARRASKLPNGNTPPFMDTLAAAYAEDGRFVQAAQIARSAIALARQAGKTELASKIETRLNLYLDKKPFRKPLP